MGEISTMKVRVNIFIDFMAWKKKRQNDVIKHLKVSPSVTQFVSWLLTLCRCHLTLTERW